MYEPHTKVTEITDRELQLRYRKYLINTIIPKKHHLTEASFYGKPAVSSTRVEGDTAYLELAHELIDRHAAALQPQTSVPPQIQSA